MSVALFFQAIAKFLLGVLLIGLLIFLPAGTLCFAKGWLLMGILFIPMFIAGIIMMLRNPQLLAKRLDAKEKLKEQGLLIKLSGLMFLAGFVVAGLDFRFGWLPLPNMVSYIATAVFLVAYLLYGRVLQENTYLSRTIEVQAGQRVIDTGLYGIVRHPMYSVTLLLFLSMPLILGSVYAFVIFLLYPWIIIRRIRSEEAFLADQLAGYSAYMEKVKYRLIPFLW